LGFGKRKKGAKTAIKEWGDAILFALIAATGIRTYVFEPFPDSDRIYGKNPPHW
jgi:signal peptidase I